MGYTDIDHSLTARRLSRLSDEFSECRAVFTALGDESRQLIFVELLRHYGGMRVGELVELVNLSRPTVSHHLRVLREAGLVDRYKDGTVNYYHVSSNLELWQTLVKLSVETEKLASEWNAALEGGMRRPFRGRKGE